MSENRSPAPMFPFAISEARPLSLTDSGTDVADYKAFAVFLAGIRGPAPALVGGYGERRAMYAGSHLFAQDEEPRDVHLGIDVWTDPATPLRAPLDGVVHSFADNDAFGDYGATIILDHGDFYTLYGHLAHRSLTDLEVGRRVDRGQVFAWLGEPEENGGWPPHLHFQKITDLLGRQGDFPGVAKMSEREHWLALCPDPSDLLV